MPKKNFSTRKAEIYQQIEEQVKKINFLNSSITEMQEKSLLSPSLEVEFSNHYFDDLFDKMKDATNEASIGLLYHKLIEEELKFKNLIKSLERVKE